MTQAEVGVFEIHALGKRSISLNASWCVISYSKVK